MATTTSTADERADPGGYALVALATLGFGMIPLFAIWTFRLGLSAEASAFWRYCIPALLLSPWLLRLRAGARDVIVLFAAGMFVGLGTYFYFAALEALPVSLAAVVYYTYPAMTLVVGWAFFAQRLGLRRIVSVALVIAGAAVTLRPSGLGPGQLGVLAMSALAPFAFAVLLNVLAVSRDGLAVPAQTAIVTSGCALALLPLALGTPGAILPATASGYAAVAGIGIVGMMLPALLLTKGLARIGAQAAGVISALELVVAMAAAWLVLGEAIGPWQTLGGALVVTASMVAALSRRRQPASGPH